MQLSEMRLSTEEYDKILWILKLFNAQWMKLIDKEFSEFKSKISVDIY